MKKNFWANLWDGCKKVAKTIGDIGISLCANANEFIQNTIYETNNFIIHPFIGNKYDKVYSETTVKKNNSTSKVKPNINIVNNINGSLSIGTSTDYGIYEKGFVFSKEFTGETHRISDITISTGISPSELCISLGVSKPIISDGDTTLYLEKGINVNIFTAAAIVFVGAVAPAVVPSIPWIGLFPALAAA